jgi:hypothetical protein
MKDKLPPAGGGINVLCQAFEANPSLLKAGHGGNQMGGGISPSGLVSRPLKYPLPGYSSGLLPSLSVLFWRHLPYQ